MKLFLEPNLPYIHTGSDYVVDAQSKVIATGTTGESGQFILISPDGRLISLQSLNDNYADKYFVLRETTATCRLQTV